MTIWLIADSGGSKTDWALIDGKNIRRTRCPGLNPNLLNPREIEQILDGPIKAWLGDVKPDRLCFFGAGLAADNVRQEMAARLRQFVGSSGSVRVETDLVAAGYACFGKGAGAVGVLGTGSVAFRWENEAVAARAGGLGHLLGDEGGGVSLGRSLCRLVARERLSPRLMQAFYAATNIEYGRLPRYLYAHPRPLRFLADLAPFLAGHREDPLIQALLRRQFSAFIAETVSMVRQDADPVMLMGGIANAFRPELSEICAESGLKRVSFLESDPIFGLAKHLTGACTDPRASPKRSRPRLN